MEWREHFWTIVLSVIFTLLLWLWAESENRETQTFSTRIMAMAVGTDAENLRVRFANPGDGARTVTGFEVALTMQGSRVALQRAETRLREVTIPLSGLRDNTDPIIDLAGHLANLPVFDELGLTFVSVEPPTVTARVDQFITRSVDINPTFAGIRVDEMTVDPPEAEVTMTRTNWELMSSLYGDEILDVNVSDDALRRLVPGEMRRITGDVRLRRELQDVATLESPTEPIVIDVKPELLIDEIEMRVPVRVQLPPAELAQYDVVIPEASQWINRVKFTGNAEMIRQLRERTWRPFAVVDLSPEDLARGSETRTKPVDIQPIPPGVTVSFPDLPAGQRPTVPLQITPREDEAPPAD